MKASIAALLEQIARELNSLPNVFSTVQWGGRAYKLPGAGGSVRKPKLLAHVSVEKSGCAICVDFKLSRGRAEEVITAFKWITPHPFRTLAPSGWVSASISTVAQCTKLTPLLRESRSLHPASRDAATAIGRTRGTASPQRAEVARRIDRVMRQKRDEGWRPRGD